MARRRRRGWRSGVSLDLPAEETQKHHPVAAKTDSTHLDKLIISDKDLSNDLKRVGVVLGVCLILVAASWVTADRTSYIDQAATELYQFLNF